MIQPQIVYEDNNIIVCMKPAGVASQSERSFENDLLSMVRTYRAAKGDISGDTHIINRLDKPVAGLVLFALNKHTASKLSAMSGEHSIEKSYYAIVRGIPDSKGIMTDYLIKDGRNNFSRVADENTPGAKKSVLAYETIESAKFDSRDYSLVRIKLYTGRHHQIRVQFASRGFGIYGDTKYNPEFAGARNVFLQLFAYRLSFANPAGADKITVEIKPSGKFLEFGYFMGDESGIKD